MTAEAGPGRPGVLLEVDHLTVAVRRQNRQFDAADDVTLRLPRGGSLGIVGESGSGKSITLRAIMGLLPRAATLRAGTVRIGGDLVHHGRGLGPADRRHRVAMVFQDALSALNPVMTAGTRRRARTRRCRASARRSGPGAGRAGSAAAGRTGR